MLVLDEINTLSDIEWVLLRNAHQVRKDFEEKSMKHYLNMEERWQKTNI